MGGDGLVVDLTLVVALRVNRDTKNQVSSLVSASTAKTLTHIPLLWLLLDHCTVIEAMLLAHIELHRVVLSPFLHDSS